MLKRELDRGINSKLQQRVKSLEQKINNIKMSIQHIKTDNEHVSQSALGLRGTSTSSNVPKLSENGRPRPKIPGNRRSRTSSRPSSSGPGSPRPLGRRKVKSATSSVGTFLTDLEDFK